MYFHILMTEVCNSQCKYCYEKSMKEFENGLDKKFKFDFSSPRDFSVDIEKLKRFILQDKNPVIIFYGGEPLLQIEKIKEIVDSFKNNKNVRFCMQTNGKLLNELPKEYMNKFSRILVSIDGDKERTDYNRGKGTYDLVLENLKLIRKNNFKGEIVARMCLSPLENFAQIQTEQNYISGKFQKNFTLPKTNIDISDIFEQIKHLFSLEVFDSVHWQIDAGFYKNDFNRRDFLEFTKKYNHSIKKLIEYWVEEMKTNKRVLKIYPFLGIFESLYYKRKTKLRCGAGYEGYAITTDGKIAACPIMNNITDFYAGDLNSKPEELKKFEIEFPCTECFYLDICGGRCLYSNKSKLWPEKGYKLICKTIIYLIGNMKLQIPEIKKLIKEKIISKKDFQYEKYFGPEIIP